MTERNMQLEAKIRNRLEKLGLNFSDQRDGTFYLSELLYIVLSDETIEDLGRAEEKVAKEQKVSVYEVQAKISDVLNIVNQEVLQSFYRAKEYNLKLIYDNIELIADDIRMD